MCHNLLHPRRGRDQDWNDIPFVYFPASVYYNNTAKAILLGNTTYSFLSGTRWLMEA
jgi:hypothetical protein